MIRVEVVTFSTNFHNVYRKEIVMDEGELALLQNEVNLINAQRAALRARWADGEDDAEFEPCYQWEVRVGRVEDPTPTSAEEVVKYIIGG